MRTAARMIVLWRDVSLKRIVLLLTLTLLFSSLLSLVSAQDDPPPSSLDEIPEGATPAPLPTRMAQPAPSSRVRIDNATLELYFETMPQGTTGLLHISGENVTGARARFINQLVDFYPIEGDGFYSLISVNMEQSPRRYPLDVFVTFTDGTRAPINAEIEVVLGNFIRQDVAIPQDKAVLLNTDVERNELARLESIFSRTTLERRWDSTGLQMPILSALTSPFGAFRTFNETLNTRHTGWDIRTTLGTPIMATAAGQVVYAGLMDIRGSYVVVDHGYGMFSGYAHLSQTHVTRGQSVAKGQVIGMTGENGRTSGPHFHWEMAVNGEWVDSVQLLQMWMP